MLAHLQTVCPGFTQYGKHAGFIFRLTREIFAMDSTTPQLKQTLQLRDFVGTSEKAVTWQVWTGLLTHVLLRFLRHVSRWGRSCSRCAGIGRTALWVKTSADCWPAMGQHG